MHTHHIPTVGIFFGHFPTRLLTRVLDCLMTLNTAYWSVRLHATDKFISEDWNCFFRFRYLSCTKKKILRVLDERNVLFWLVLQCSIVYFGNPCSSQNFRPSSESLNLVIWPQVAFVSGAAAGKWFTAVKISLETFVFSSYSQVIKAHGLGDWVLCWMTTLPSPIGSVLEFFCFDETY